MKNNKKKAAIAIALSVAMSTQAFAAVVEHDISTGDLIIDKATHVEGDTYLVTGSSDDYTISVLDGIDTSITLKKTNIEVVDESAIHIGAGSDVELVISGKNTVSSTYEWEDYAAIHVSDATSSLTITGDGDESTNDYLQAYSKNYNYAAAIGSNGYETDNRDMNASITIDGVEVKAFGYGSGAAIGSGEGGDMNGSITIKNAEIFAYSDEGAAIGSGEGDMNGSITIKDSEIFASSEYGAGIGSGDGGNMTGDITITDSYIESFSEYDGAGIGSGSAYYESADDGNIVILTQSGIEEPIESEPEGEWLGGEMSGSITIKDSEVYAESHGNGAAIGSGMHGNMSGDITIGGNAEVRATAYNDGAGIGAGGAEDYVDSDLSYGGEMSGSITIGDSAFVSAKSEDSGAGIGSGDSGEMSGKITIGDSAQVYAESNDDGAGIGSGEGGIMSGSITIKDNALINAVGDSEGAGIGAGEDSEMSGEIFIGDNAQVVAIGGDEAAAIGGDSASDIIGIIHLADNAVILLAQGGIGREDAEQDPELIDEVSGNGTYIIEEGVTIYEASYTDKGFDLIETYTGKDGYEKLAHLLGSDGTNFFSALSSDAPIESHHIVWNESKTVSAILYGDDLPAALLETLLSDEARALLIGDTAEEKVLYAGELSFDKAYADIFWLRFNVGIEYAGKTVTMNYIDKDGNVVSVKAKVTANGEVLHLTNTLGSFAIIAE